jgi:hypothetical protein
MIEDEEQLRYAYEVMVRMHNQRERCAVEPLWHPTAREDVVEGIENQMRKVEREIAEYLAKKYAEELPEREAAPAA